MTYNATGEFPLNTWTTANVSTSCCVSGCALCRPLPDQRLGWTCPGCGSCYGPHIAKCFTCGGSWRQTPYTYTITTTGTGFQPSTNTSEGK